jgi:hypothetical protein
MMSGVPLETCWAFNKLWNNKFYYKLHLVGYFSWVILRCTDPRILKRECYVLLTCFISLYTTRRLKSWKPPISKSTVMCLCARGLRRGSAVARQLRLWVRIPPGTECLSLLSVVFCQVSASGLFLVQRSPTEGGVSEYDREGYIKRRSWPNRGCCAMGKKSSCVFETNLLDDGNTSNSARLANK